MFQGFYGSHKPIGVQFYGINTVNPIKLETGLRPNSAGIPIHDS